MMVQLSFSMNTLFIEKTGSLNTKLYTKNSNLLVCTGYTRVIDGKNIYVECNEHQIELASFQVPKDQLYRFLDKRVYFIEMLSRDVSNTKLTFQLKAMHNCDYRIGMFYISPFDLYFENGLPTINCTEKINTKAFEFFD